MELAMADAISHIKDIINKYNTDTYKSCINNINKLLHTTYTDII